MLANMTVHCYVGMVVVGCIVYAVFKRYWKTY